MTPAKKNISRRLSQAWEWCPTPQISPLTFTQIVLSFGRLNVPNALVVAIATQQRRGDGEKRTVWILCPDPMGGFLHGFGRCCECTRRARSLRGPSAPRSGHRWQRNGRRGGCTFTPSPSSIQHSNVWRQNKFQQASVSYARVTTVVVLNVYVVLFFFMLLLFMKNYL